MNNDDLWRAELSELREKFRKSEPDVWLTLTLWPADRRVLESELYRHMRLSREGMTFLARVADGHMWIYEIGLGRNSHEQLCAAGDQLLSLGTRGAEALCRCSTTITAGVAQSTVDRGPTSETWLLAIFDVLTPEWYEETCEEMAAWALPDGTCDRAIANVVVRSRRLENIFLESAILIERLLNPPKALPAKPSSDTREGILAPATPTPSPQIPVKPKRSSERGEGLSKLIPALTHHHQYAKGGCLNLEPIGNNALARLAEVSRSTASQFFKEKFGGLRKYQTMCTKPDRLVASLKLLNNEFSPDRLFGGSPPGEKDRDEED